MNLEIERKFILKSIPKTTPVEKIKIEQWYHKIDDVWERVRKCESSKNGVYYVHTIKTPVSDLANMEDEKLLTKEEFNSFVKLCVDDSSKFISKERLVYPHTGGLKWEVDVFNSGHHLIIAEIEIPSEDYEVKIPKFIKQKLLLEVTGMKQFSNKSLSNFITTKKRKRKQLIKST